ncbi:PfkB family carbohydrate kinase, partial [Dubosiella newyorkensis]
MAVFVIGSMNIDMFFDVDHFVRAKETLLPDRCEVLPGGKGLNQACACSKAGAKTFMAGKIGSDRKILLDALNQARVDARFVQIDENDMSGRAIIQRDPSGENCILLVPGLNHALECEDFENVLEKIGENDIVLLQNEISNLCVLAKLLKEKGAFVVFNPAPVTDSIPKDLSFVSILVVNEVEIEQLLSKTGDPKKLCEE